jgi:NADP-dependent 3-hydroxy acid dehydrogenase YdfG
MIENIPSLKELKESIDLNVTSYIWFTKRFLETFKDRAEGLTIVNISSLCAVKPFHSCGVYCTTKAARDMLAGVVALEVISSVYSILSLTLKGR